MSMKSLVSANTQNRSRRTLSLAIIFLATIVAFTAIASVIQAQAITSPRCSFKIDGGELINELPDTLDGGSRLYIKCRVEQNDRQQPWEAQTELNNVDWQINGDSRGTKPRIEIDEFSGSAVIELEGIVPMHRMWLEATSESEPYEPYAMEASPPYSMRVVSLGKNGYFNYHVETHALHPLNREAKAKLSELQESVSADVLQQIEPLIASADQTIDEGRPWATLELIDTVSPIVEALSNEKDARQTERFLVFLAFIVGLLIGAGGFWFVTKNIIPRSGSTVIAATRD